MCEKCKDTGYEERERDGNPYVVRCTCRIIEEKQRLLSILPPEQGRIAAENPGSNKVTSDFLDALIPLIRAEFLKRSPRAFSRIFFYYGPNGTGKTTAACSMFVKYVRMLKDIDYRLMPRYISQAEFGKIAAAFDLDNFLFNSKEFEVIRLEATHIPFLVIDDIPSIESGDPAERALKTLLDGCPFVVITGNWSPNPEKELYYGNHFPGTISSFLGGTRTHWVPFFGENRR